MEVLWRKMRLWKKMPPKEGKDFVFINFKDTDLTGIQIIEGEYKDVVYHYHQARVVEEGMGARLKFGYTIVYPGEHDIDVLNDDEGFVTMMGDILTQLIMDKAKADDQIRTDNSEKFNLQ